MLHLVHSVVAGAEKQLVQVSLSKPISSTCACIEPVHRIGKLFLPAVMPHGGCVILSACVHSSRLVFQVAVAARRPLLGHANKMLCMPIVP
jgi:hypothetical protein